MKRLRAVTRCLQVSGVFSLFVGIACASCVNPGQGSFRWENCFEMAVYPDPSLNNIPAGTGAGAGGPSVSSQIGSALSAWSSALAIYVPTVNIPYFYPTNSLTSSNVVVSYGYLGSQCAVTNVEGTVVSSATITLDSSGLCTDPTNAAYQNYYQRLLLHELGHLFGLADYDQGAPCNFFPGTTVMARTCGADDQGGGIPTSKTTCDSSEVYSIYLGTSDPTCSSGGGGCGSGCTDPCTGACLNSCAEDPSDCGGSPIVIDVLDRGFHLTSVANGVRFRTLQGGPLYHMSWTDAPFGNGWLALDRNGNGTIDDFGELFGNLTAQPPSRQPNGFLALAVFDEPANGGNGDGFIDASDAVYSHLRVWVDANHNGFSEATELHTLQELGIFRLALKYHETPFVDQYGNSFRFLGSLWDEGGKEKEACYDVFLQIRTN